MKNRVIKIIFICFLLSVICMPVAKATNLNVTAEEQRVEIESKMNEITESMQGGESNSNAYIYMVISTVAISMVFEYFVKKYKFQIREKKFNGEKPTKQRKQLYAILGIHIVVMIILLIICKFALKLNDIFTGFIIFITIYIVWIGTTKILFRNSEFKKKEERGKNNDITQ